MSHTPVIVGLGGSLREKSFSRAGLQTALDLTASEGADAVMLDLRELNLPMYIPDYDIGDYPAAHHAGIRRLVDEIRRADVLIWASPTYHGAMTGALKNAIDFIEFLSDEPKPYLQERAVGLMAIPDRLTFTAMADSVHELRAWLAPTRVLLNKNDFNPDMTLQNERTIRRIKRLIDELLKFARMHGGNAKS